MGQGRRIEVQTGAIFAAALALLILPLSFFLSFLIAGGVHECCHWLALRWTGTRVYRISIGPFGAVMETPPMEPGREVVCALAGPMGSFLLVPFYHVFPEAALCALVQGCFNLLPVYPLDGGRILRGLLEILKIPGREAICSGVQGAAALGICGLCVFGFFRWDLGFGVLFLGAMMVLRTFPRKTPCKDSPMGVQ